MTTPIFNEFSLKDRVILITGGARGLGLAQAQACVEAGAIVHILDVLPTPPEEYESTAKVAEELGHPLTYHQVDVLKGEALEKIAEEIATQRGRMDGLIAAAGIHQSSTALDYEQSQFEKVIGINLTGVFLTARAVARQMIRLGNSGSIVLVASMSGTIANKGIDSTAYNASKSGVLQLGRNLAAEWGPHGIRVNTLSPGYALTAIVENAFKMNEDYRTQFPKENFLGRISQPREYRGAVVFLLSDASGFMTGSDLRIDGGHSAW